MTDIEIEYYDWDGIPCRVMRSPTGRRQYAEYYEPAEGFQPVSITELRWEGQPITKAAFQQMIISARRCQ